MSETQKTNSENLPS